MKYKILLASIFACPLLILSSCQSQTPIADNNLPTTSNTSPSRSIESESLQETKQVKNKHNLATKVKFKLENGSEAFSLKPKENGIKVEGADGSEIARLTVDDNSKIKIKNSADQTLGYVVTKDNYWKLENAEQTKELYILRQQTDGDYKLETTDNKQIYRLKRRDYGWEIETPQKQSLYKVKAKGNKIVLRDKDDITVIKTKSNFPLLAVACFGFDVLTQEQQSALAYAVSLAEK